MTTSELNDIEVLCGVDTVELQADTMSKADLSRLAYVHDNATERLADGKFRYIVNADTAAAEMRAAYKVGFKDGVAMIREIQD